MKIQCMTRPNKLCESHSTVAVHISPKQRFVTLLRISPYRVGLVVSMSASHTVGREFASRPGHTKDHNDNSANALALCHPPSANFC